MRTIIMSAEEPPEWFQELVPRVVPAGWNNSLYYNVFDRHDRLRVIFTGTTESDGKRWLHLSASFPNRLPNWDELKLVKDMFIGRDKLAVQVLPRAEEYVNCHPYALHLWTCLDGDPVPDFRKEGTL